jgi:hypothetical protein
MRATRQCFSLMDSFFVMPVRLSSSPSHTPRAAPGRGARTAFALLALFGAPGAVPLANASTVESMLKNIVDLMQPAWSLLGTWAMVFGLVFVIAAIIAATRSRRDGGGMGPAVIGFIAGILLISINAFMNTASSLVTLGGMDGVMTYTPSNGSGTVYALALRFAIYTVQLVGFWAVIKGLRLMREAAYDRKAWSSATMHLIGGIVSINIITLIQSVAVTIGGAFQTVVTHILGA